MHAIIIKGSIMTIENNISTVYMTSHGIINGEKINNTICLSSSPSQ